MAPGSALASAMIITSLGPARPSIPTVPATWRLASCTQGLPGPTTTATGAIVAVP